MSNTVANRRTECSLPFQRANVKRELNELKSKNSHLFCLNFASGTGVRSGNGIISGIHRQMCVIPVLILVSYGVVRADYTTEQFVKTLQSPSLDA